MGLSLGELISRSVDFQSALYSVTVQQIETEVWEILWTTENTACMSTMPRLKWHSVPEVRRYNTCLTFYEWNAFVWINLSVRQLFYI